MIKHLLLCRAARTSSRGGFTLVELLVVIGIIAILAGVALGPITNGIKQAKHNAAMQNARQIGSVCFSYSTDNTLNGNAYPAGTTSEAIANLLISSSYITDPAIFCISGAAGGQTPYVTTGSGVFNLASTNVTWNFTCQTATTTGGITSTASDLLPLVYFSGGTALTWGTAGAKDLVLSTSCPFSTDGAAVFYKGNNAAYIKAGAVTPGTITSFVSGNFNDTATYVEVKP